MSSRGTELLQAVILWSMILSLGLCYVTEREILMVNPLAPGARTLSRAARRLTLTWEMVYDRHAIPTLLGFKKYKSNRPKRPKGRIVHAWAAVGKPSRERALARLIIGHLLTSNSLDIKISRVNFQKRTAFNSKFSAFISLRSFCHSFAGQQNNLWNERRSHEAHEGNPLIGGLHWRWNNFFSASRCTWSLENQNQKPTNPRLTYRSFKRSETRSNSKMKTRDKSEA